LTTNPARGRWSAPRIAILVAILMAVTVALSACGGDPFSYQWSDIPDTAQIYSLARPELNIEPGFSFYDGYGLIVELPSSTGRWDVALDTDAGQLVLLPPGALGITSRAKIAALPGVSYEDVIQAPGDGQDNSPYVEDAAVPVELGTIYVIRTNLRPGSFGSACTYYAKMEPLIVDAVGGTLTFRYVTNPICNNRDLVPPN